MIEISRFKKMLALYGTDLNRWEGLEPAVIRAHIKRSKEAAALYRQQEELERALDMYKVEDPDEELLEGIMAQLDMPRLKEKSLLSRRGFSGFWSGMGFQPAWPQAAVAACMVFVAAAVVFSSGGSGPAPKTTEPVTLAATDDTGIQSGTDKAFLQHETALFIAEAEALIAEDLRMRHILAFEGQAAADETERTASSPRRQDEDIELFLDELFAAEVERPDTGIWELLEN